LITGSIINNMADKVVIKDYFKAIDSLECFRAYPFNGLANQCAGIFPNQLTPDTLYSEY